MKMTRLALAIATTAMASTPVLATNGDNMIGTGAHEIAMGGTGAAGLHGAEGILNNVASIGEVKGTEFNLGGTLFMPTIKTSMSSTGFPAEEQKSDGDTYVIPAVSTATRINDNLVFGIGMWGTSGMGVDYSQKDNLGYGGALDISSNLQILKFAPSLTYNQSNFSVGFAPILQYGSLDIHHNQSAFTGLPGYGGATTVGAGASSDLGWGYTLGASYKIAGLKLGVAYDSAIAMKYEDQITTQANAFGGAAAGLDFGDKLEQPAQIKVGASYDIGAFQIAADYKHIAWGDATGYKDFGWENQNVYTLGGKYTQKNFWLGVGYNYADNPIDEQDGSTYAGAATNFFNLAFFPATAESHFTFGGGYSLTKNLSLDAAMAYAPETKTTFDISGVVQGLTTNPAGEGEVSTKHSEMSYTVQLSYKF